jgi:chorismate mutase
MWRHKMSIEELRNEIDRIDDEIINLLGKRKDLVAEIAKIKKESDNPVYDKDREQKIIGKLKKMAKEKGLDENFVSSLYAIILKDSKENQERIVKH